MALGNLAHATWWAPEVLFGIGMGLAFNADKVKGDTYNLLSKILKAVGGGNSMPDQIIRHIDGNKEKLVYNIIKAFLYASLVWNIFYNLAVPVESRKWGIENVLLTYYTLLTAGISAKDILLDKDDKGLWGLQAKRRHILFPINLEGTKKYTTLSATKAKTEIDSIARKMPHHLQRTVLFGVAAAVTFRLHPVLYFFTFCPAVFYFNHHLNTYLDFLIDVFWLRNVGNQYPHIFGNVLDIVSAGEADDNHGYQYEYFNRFSKPLTKYVRQYFYSKAKNKYKLSTKESRAVAYFGRGLVVSSTLWMMNVTSQDIFLKNDNAPVLKNVLSFVPHLLYYGAHSAAAVKLSEDRLMDERWKRTIVGVGECIFSGYLFYYPICKGIFPN